MRQAGEAEAAFAVRLDRCGVGQMRACAPLPKFVIHRGKLLHEIRKQKAHKQRYVASAAYRFDVPECDCSRCCRNVKSAALVRRFRSSSSIAVNSCTNFGSKR